MPLPRSLPLIATVMLAAVFGCEPLPGAAPPVEQAGAPGEAELAEGARRAKAWRIAAIETRLAPLVNSKPVAPPTVGRPVVLPSRRPVVRLQQAEGAAGRAPERAATVTLRAVIEGEASGLTFRWKAAAGSLQPDTGPEVVWTPPAQPGSYLITLEVTDARGCLATAELRVNVSQTQLIPVPFKPGPHAVASCPPAATAAPGVATGSSTPSAPPAESPTPAPSAPAPATVTPAPSAPPPGGSAPPGTPRPGSTLWPSLAPGAAMVMAGPALDAAPEAKERLVLAVHPGGTDMRVGDGQFVRQLSLIAPTPTPTPRPTPSGTSGAPDVPAGVYTLVPRGPASPTPHTHLAFDYRGEQDGRAQGALYLAGGDRVGDFRLTLDDGTPVRIGAFAMGESDAGLIWDATNSKLVRFKIGYFGQPSTRTVLQARGDGYADGPLHRAAFRDIADLVYDRHARAYYVADRGNACIRRIGADDVVTTLPGLRAGQAAERRPDQLAVGADGTVYFSDTQHQIHRLTPAGQLELFKPTSAEMEDVGDLAYDARNRRLLVAVKSSGRVLAVGL